MADVLGEEKALSIIRSILPHSDPAELLSIDLKKRAYAKAEEEARRESVEFSGASSTWIWLNLVQYEGVGFTSDECGRKPSLDEIDRCCSFEDL